MSAKKDKKDKDDKEDKGDKEDKKDKKDEKDKKDKSPGCGEVESDCAQMRSTSTSSRSVGEANASSQPCPATASPTTQGRVALMPAVRLRASARILPLLKWSWYGPAVAKPEAMSER